MAANKQTGAYVVQNHTLQSGSREELVSIRSKLGEEIAYNTLGDKALRIYLMLSSNRDGFQCLMSSNEIAGKPLPMGMSRATFTRAVTELKDNGFLIKRKDEDVWDFYDKPPIDGMLVEVHKTEEVPQI